MKLDSNDWSGGGQQTLVTVLLRSYSVQRIVHMKLARQISLALAIPVLLAFASSVKVDDPPGSGGGGQTVCQAALNTGSIAAGCVGPRTHCSPGVMCCPHYHLAIQYNSLINTGANTGKRWKKVQKKWHRWTTEACGDHDDNSSTPNTCLLDQSGSTADDANSNPDHFVYDHYLEDC